MGGEFEDTVYDKPSSSKKFNKIKDVFKNDILYTHPHPFIGVKVLKTKDGLVAMLIYMFTSFVSSLMFFGVNFNGGISFHENFWIYVLIGILLVPMGMSFGYTAPLKKALNIGARKYPLYLAYYLIVLLIILILLGVMVVLTLIGLCLGLAIGVIFLFYVIYRIFLTPGVIALTNQPLLDCIDQSIQLTKGWEPGGLFIVYLIVFLVIQYISDYLLPLVMEGRVDALILIIILNIPLFIIAASITLFVASFREYTTQVLEIEDSESAE